MSRRQRIVFFDHVALLSGGELALARLIPELVPSFYVAVVLAEDGPLRAELERAGAEVVVAPLPSRVRDARRSELLRPQAAGGAILDLVRYVLVLRSLLRDCSADLVHANSLKSGFYGCVAARLAGLPVVWQVRDRVAPDYLPAAVVGLTRLALRLLPTAVLCNSAATEATVLAGGPWLRRRRPVVVYDAYQPPSCDVPTRRSAGPGIRAAMVGRLAPWKGQLDVAYAFAAAFPAPSTSELVFIGSAMFGEDTYQSELESLIARLGLGGRIALVGFQHNVQAELRRSDVLVHFSTVPEPFGQVVVEGMAEGLAVVAAASGGPAEIITDGINGILVPAGNRAALTASLVRLAEEPQLRQQLGAAARTRAADFVPSRIVPAVVALYESVLRPRRSTRRTRGPFQ